MGMINSQRMLLCRNVVAQRQIQLIQLSTLPRDRRNGIVGLSLRLSKDKRSLIRIASPRLQNMFCQVDDPILICTLQADHGKRPFYNTCRHILISLYRKILYYRSLCHGEGIMPALEMVMAQDGTAHDWKICIGSQEIVGELLYKIK